MSNENKHDWVCISPGMYDSLYKCSKCDAKHMNQADKRSTWEFPETNCTESKSNVHT